MITIEKTVLPSPEQWQIIIEGLRNPKNSWDLIDSYIEHIENPQTLNTANFQFHLGEADHKLMTTLAKGGPVHAKYRRMIPVFFTVVAPTFWWIEFDTYKVGVVRNSCSKMHKIHVAEFTMENFTHEGCDEVPMAKAHLAETITRLEWLRLKFNETQEKKYWRALIELLPHGYMMRATIFLTYEVLANIYHSRHTHKVLEWHTFCDWIRRLPYSDLIIGEEKEKSYRLSKIDAKILVAYADNSMNVFDTAQQLFMHRNSVLYHFKKITKSTGKNPRKFHDLCQLLPAARQTIKESGESDGK